MAEYCSDGRFAVYTTYWENQGQYAARSGKLIGVNDSDISRLQNDRNQYGYLMAEITTGILDSVLATGFSANNIYLFCGSPAWQNDVNFGISRGVTMFYIDEPIQNGLQQIVRDAAPYIANAGGTLTISEQYFNDLVWYVLGGRGNIGDMIDLALSINPSPFVSCHTHFESGFWHDIDPRDQWTYIKGRVPSLFQMAWIKTRQSAQEMSLLFGHANNLGLNQILLYPFASDSTTYIGRLELAAEQAWFQLWLTRFQKQVRSKWCCTNQQYNPDECTFQSSEYTGETRWA